MKQIFPDQRLPQALLYGLLVLIYAFVVFWASPNLRGSDQYWYVGDVERVVMGDGEFKTNSIFPLSMPEDLRELPRPWVQNKPATYLVLPIAALVGNGHFAWLIFNILAVFLSAQLIARALSLTPANTFWFTALFLFFPFNFYLVTQALPEVFVMMLLSGIMLIAARKPLTVPNAVLLAVLCGILIWQRSNYLLLVPAIIALFVWTQRKNALLPTLAFTGVTGLMVWLAPMLFPEHLVKLPSIRDIILLNKQGGSNMGAFFENYNNSAVTLRELLGVILEKAWGALVVQLEVTSLSNTMMFYLVTLMFPALLIAIFRRDLDSRMRFSLIVLAGIHLATIVLFYNQYRYAAAVMPALFFSNIYLLRKASWGRKTALKTFLLAGALLVSVVIGRQLRIQSLEEHQMMTSLSKGLKGVKAGGFLCQYKSGQGLGFGYAASPLPVYFFDKYEPDNLLAAAHKLGATHVAVSKRSLQYPQWKSNLFHEMPILQTDWVLFKLPDYAQQ